MKRLTNTIFLPLFILVVFCQSALGQTESAENDNPIQTIESSENYLDNTFYLKAGLGPKNQYADVADFPFSEIDEFSNNFAYDFGADSWLNVEIGSIFYFGSEDEMYRIGMDVTFLNANYIPTDWADAPIPVGATNLFAESDPVLFAKSEIGPVISFNPVGFWVFDAFYQIGPTFGNAPGGFLEYEIQNGFVEQELFSEGESTVEYLGLSHSAGVSVRIPYLVVSLTAMFGEWEYDNLLYYASFSDDTTFLDDETQITNPMKLKGVTISAGLHF